MNGLCPYQHINPNIQACPYKKNFFALHKKIQGQSLCLNQDKKDYRETHSSWLGAKMKCFYHSSCPMVSGSWWQDK